MSWVHNGRPVPPTQTYDLDDISEWRTILAVSIVLTALMAAVVALRAYTRGQVVHALGADDWVTFISAFCAFIYSALCIDQTRWGLGLPVKDRPVADLDDYSMVNYAGRPFYIIGILGFKVALCLAYLRILNASRHVIYKTITYVVLITCITCHITGVFLLIFQCSPVKKAWRPQTPGLGCIPNGPLFYGLAIMAIIFDVIIFVLPIPLLMGLNIEIKKRLVLCGVFLLGLLTTVCSILRATQINKTAKTGNSTMLVLWGVIELNAGIILTCIPTLGPLLPCFSNSTAGSSLSQTHESYKLSPTSATFPDRTDRSQGAGTAGTGSGSSRQHVCHVDTHNTDSDSQPSSSILNNHSQASDEEIASIGTGEAGKYRMNDDALRKTTRTRMAVEGNGRAGRR